MKYSKDNYYSCYSPKLRDYLTTFGFEPCDTFVHLKTDRTCWVYEKNEQLSKYLKSWTQNKV